MKKTKKIVALLLALVMCLGLTAPAVAVELPKPELPSSGSAAVDKIVEKVVDNVMDNVQGKVDDIVDGIKSGDLSKVEDAVKDLSDTVNSPVGQVIGAAIAGTALEAANKGFDQAVDAGKEILDKAEGAVKGEMDKVVPQIKEEIENAASELEQQITDQYRKDLDEAVGQITAAGDALTEAAEQQYVRPAEDAAKDLDVPEPPAEGEEVPEKPESEKTAADRLQDAIDAAKAAPGAAQKKVDDAVKAEQDAINTKYTAAAGKIVDDHNGMVDDATTQAGEAQTAAEDAAIKAADTLAMVLDTSNGKTLQEKQAAINEARSDVAAAQTKVDDAKAAVSAAQADVEAAKAKLAALELEMSADVDAANARIDAGAEVEAQNDLAVAKAAAERELMIAAGKLADAEAKEQQAREYAAVANQVYLAADAAVKQAEDELAKLEKLTEKEQAAMDAAKQMSDKKLSEIDGGVEDVEQAFVDEIKAQADYTTAYLSDALAQQAKKSADDAVQATKDKISELEGQQGQLNADVNEKKELQASIAAETTKAKTLTKLANAQNAKEYKSVIDDASSEIDSLNVELYGSVIPPKLGYAERIPLLVATLGTAEGKLAAAKAAGASEEKIKELEKDACDAQVAVWEAQAAQKAAEEKKAALNEIIDEYGYDTWREWSVKKNNADAKFNELQNQKDQVLENVAAASGAAAENEQKLNETKDWSDLFTGISDAAAEIIAANITLAKDEAVAAAAAIQAQSTSDKLYQADRDLLAARAARQSAMNDLQNIIGDGIMAAEDYISAKAKLNAAMTASDLLTASKALLEEARKDALAEAENARAAAEAVDAAQKEYFAKAVELQKARTAIKNAKPEGTVTKAELEAKLKQCEAELLELTVNWAKAEQDLADATRDLNRAQSALNAMIRAAREAGDETEILEEQVPLAGMVAIKDLLAYLYVREGFELELSDEDSTDIYADYTPAIEWGKANVNYVEEKHGQPDDLVIVVAAEDILTGYAAYKGSNVVVKLEDREPDDIVDDIEDVLSDFLARLG